MHRVYLDHLAGTPVLSEVFEAMRPYYSETFGNPSSLHQHGLLARDAVNKARAQIADLLNAEPEDEILFTSCGTEAANLAVKGVAYANQRRGNHIVVSAIEHPSILGSAEFLEKQGFVATRVPVDTDGFISPEAVRAAITERTILVAVHCANHDIGTIQPCAEIGRITAEKGIAYYVDANTSGGWLPMDVRAVGANLVSLSPHRFYGPKGVGVLYRNRRARLVSILHGGDQENGRRSGTENVAAIVGAGMAAEIARRELPARMEHTRRLQHLLLDGIRSAVPYVKLSGPEPGPQRISTSLSINTEFVEGEGQLLLLDIHGIAVASGSSCVSKALKISHVLQAIGLDPALAQGNLIFSLGKDNTETEIQHVVATFGKVVSRLREMSPSWDEFQRGLIDSVVLPRGRG
jgi:cysteine desulfurase